MNVNLEYYKIFYYVGKHKSITIAAEELSISQPAVSQAVKQLEKALGSSLFVRTSKGVHLTSEGETLYSYIKIGYEYILLGEKKFQELQEVEAGEIRIGASDMTLQFYLLSFLEIFHEKYPKIKISVTNGPTPETLRYIKEGKIDFGVVSSPLSDTKEFKIQKVRQIEDVFVAGSRFKHLKGNVLSYKELEKLPIICLEGNTSTRAYVDKFLKENNVTLHPEFEFAISDMLVQFALKNLGVAGVVKDFAEKYIESGELFQLKFEEEIPKRDFCIVTDEKIPMSTAARKLIQFLK